MWDCLRVEFLKRVVMSSADEEGLMGNGIVRVATLVCC